LEPFEPSGYLGDVCRVRQIACVGRNRFIAPLCDAVARCADTIARSETGRGRWRNKAIAPYNRPVVAFARSL